MAAGGEARVKVWLAKMATMRPCVQLAIAHSARYALLAHTRAHGKYPGELYDESSEPNIEKRANATLDAGLMCVSGF